MNARPQQGAALVTVLWLGVILALIAATMAGQQNNRVQSLQLQYDLLREHYALAAGEQWLLHRLLSRETGDGMPDLPDSWTFAGYQLMFQVQPEDELLNVNQAQSPALHTLLQGLAIDEPVRSKLIDQLLDWRDTDDLVRAHGAEQRHYQKTPLKTPANRPFIHLDELNQVRDITPELAWKLRPWLSLHSRAASPGQALLARLPVVVEGAEPAFQLATGNTWRLTIQGWQGSQSIGALETIQRKQAIATSAPYMTLSWQIMPWQSTSTTRRTANASDTDAE